MKKILIAIVYFLLISPFAYARQQSESNALLWQVSGKGLNKPSYLFGTFHLLTNAFVDTLAPVLKAYQATDMVVGELLVDESLQAAVIEASALKGTTLKQLLPDTLYSKVDRWFKKEAGMDLVPLDGFNPMTIVSAALAITKQKYFPNAAGEVQLDTYFQEQAKKDGKKVMGLETIDIQINALFKQLTLNRQIELLNETFAGKEDLKDLIAIMSKAYIAQNMSELMALMYGSSFKPEEKKVLLDDRNNHWMKQLPGLMQQSSLFVAVGALHLGGSSGLIQQLRSQGYTVTPVVL